MKPLAPVLALFLAGCATLDNPNLNADQIKAIVSAKSASAVCVNIVGVGGTQRVVYVNLDESRVSGSINVDPSTCGVVMNTTPPTPAATPVPSKPIPTPPVTP